MTIQYTTNGFDPYNLSSGALLSQDQLDPNNPTLLDMSSVQAGQRYNDVNTTYNQSTVGGGGGVLAYDDSKYSSPALAWLDNMPGRQWGAGSNGLSSLVTQLGLDPVKVLQAANQARSSGLWDPSWDSGPQSDLQRILQADPSLMTPQVQALLNSQQFQQQSQAGQQQSSNSYDVDNPAQSMHANDYYTIAAGLGSILGAGYLGGAFSGLSGAADAGAGAWTSGYDLAGDTGLQGISGASAADTAGLSEFGGNPAVFNGASLPSTGGASGSGIGGGAGGTGGLGAANPYETVINGLTNSSATNPFEAQVGSSLGGQGVTSATGPLANGLGGQIANGGLGSTISGLANGGSIGGTSASGANGLGSAITSYASNPTNYLSTIGNLINQSNLASNLSGIANQAGSMSNQANNPEAQAAYSQFMNYVNNPSAYINNVGAPITNAIVQGLPPSIAKSGNLAGSLSAAITSANSALSGNYNGFLATLGSQTGLQQGTGNAGSVYGNLAGQGAVANASAYSGLGSLLAGLGKSATSGSGSTTSSTTNPFGTTYS